MGDYGEEGFPFSKYSLVLHHGGTFKEQDGDLLDVGGEKDIWDVDSNRLSGIEIVDSFREVGYANNIQQTLYKIPRKGLKNGLRELYKQSLVIELLGHRCKTRTCDVYVKHNIDVAEPWDGGDEDVTGSTMAENERVLIKESGIGSKETTKGGNSSKGLGESSKFAGENEGGNGSVGVQLDEDGREHNINTSESDYELKMST